MLKKEFRLPKVSLKGQRFIKSKSFNLKVSANGGSSSRFAFVVSKKVDKRATARNRIKRKFRNCIEENLELINKGYDFLFILKENIDDRDHCQELIDILKKENLFNEKSSDKVN